ncbi:MAG: hypothetical protein M2R45_05324 [Verrucomicrobia subdivision 3 bacterium]|nr:hypothetical protein [Limisphaerales bacterium]MCS1415720.1 hypothetical protein [Limisphaerales bacterium]
MRLLVGFFHSVLTRTIGCCFCCEAGLRVRISGCILPALKRVRRISSNSKSGTFVGSEFAYKELRRRKVKSITYLKQEMIEGWRHM